MALVERNLPLSKSRSRSSVTNKKLTLSSTISDLKSTKSLSNENKNPSEPILKEPVLLQPKRTLSKFKANIDLKSIHTSEETAKSKTTSIEQISTIPKGLYKSRTSAKLVPFNGNTKAIHELVPTQKSLSKSRTSTKLIPSLDIVSREPLKSLSRSKASSILLKDESDKKTLSKTATSVHLQSVGGINIDTKDEKKILSKHSSSNKIAAPRRRSSRVSLKLQPLEVFSSFVDINIDDGCDSSSSNEKLNNCKKNEHIDTVTSNTLPQPQVPEKSILSKSKTVTKLKNAPVAIPNTFRKTRSQSLMQKTLVPAFVPDIEIDEQPQTEATLTTSKEPKDDCQTPKTGKQVGNRTQNYHNKE